VDEKTKFFSLHRHVFSLLRREINKQEIKLMKRSGLDKKIPYRCGTAPDSHRTSAHHQNYYNFKAMFLLEDKIEVKLTINLHITHKKIHILKNSGFFGKTELLA